MHPRASRVVEGAQARRARVVPDERVAERRPRARCDALAGRRAEGAPLRGVAHEIGDPRPEVAEVARAVQPAVDAAAHEVDWAAAPRGDHGHGAGHRLLDRLPEGLALAGMHEDVEPGDGFGEGVAGQVPEEHGVRQAPLQHRTVGTVADDHEADAGESRQRGEISDLLLGRETTDVPDDGAAVAHVRPPPLAAPGGGEAVEVDAAPPERDPIHPEILQLCERGGRGGEREGGSPVQPGDVPFGERRRPRQTVATGVGDDVGLVDRDGRQAQVVGRDLRLPAEEEGRGQVHDVGAEGAQSPRKGRAVGSGQPHGRVARQRERRDALGGHGGGAVAPAPGRGGDDEHVVTGTLQARRHLEDGAGDSVHVGQECLCDDRDSHVSTVAGIARSWRVRPGARESVHAMPDVASPSGKPGVVCGDAGCMSAVRVPFTRSR